MFQGRFISSWLFIGFCALTVLSPLRAFAANVDVCNTCTYQTINAAIAASHSGDTIRIAQGTYNESVTLNDSKSLRLEGGYNSNFTTRAPLVYPSIIEYASVNYFSSGDYYFDGITFSGNQGTALFGWSQNSNMSVTNCRFINNPGSAIYILTMKGINIVGNTFISNSDPSDTYFTAAIYSVDSLHTQLEVADNYITGSTCKYCYGILLSGVKSADVISRNTVEGNTYGISVSALNATATPLIEWNISNSNTKEGFSLSSGSSVFQHNVAYDNGSTGMLAVSPGAIQFLHNVTARNGRHGLSLEGSLQGSNQPNIRENIFFNNEMSGLNISGSSGWGGTNIYPVSEYNNFYANGVSEMVHSSEYPWGFEYEEPGSYGEINAPSFSKYNMKHDPGFVDAEHGNFALRADSFLIDAGKPSDPFNLEPSPHGNRINIGLYGNTSQAETTAATPQIRNLTVWTNGNDVMLLFDADAATVTNWMTLEYYNGSSFVAATSSNLVGDNVAQGYKGARITTGTNRVVTWLGGLSLLSTNEVDRVIRLTLQRGNDTDVVSVPICSSCASIYGGLVPVQSPAPTYTPIASPSPVSTVAPLPTDSVESLPPALVPIMTPIGTPRVSPQPTQIPNPIVSPGSRRTLKVSPLPQSKGQSRRHNKKKTRRT